MTSNINLPRPSPSSSPSRLGKRGAGGSVQRSIFFHGVSPLGGNSPLTISALTNTGIACPVSSLNFRCPRTVQVSPSLSSDQWTRLNIGDLHSSREAIMPEWLEILICVFPSALKMSSIADLALTTIAAFVSCKSGTHSGSFSANPSSKGHSGYSSWIVDFELRRSQVWTPIDSRSSSLMVGMKGDSGV
jgi:hypothetical protein